MRSPNFAVTAPASATAGTSFSVTVTARNASNATITGYVGTVHFTSSDPRLARPARRLHLRHRRQRRPHVHERRDPQDRAEPNHHGQRHHRRHQDRHRDGDGHRGRCRASSPSPNSPTVGPSATAWTDPTDRHGAGRLRQHGIQHGERDARDHAGHRNRRRGA